VGKWSIQVLVGLPSASARPTPPREDTRHLGCLPLCWVKHTRHMALQLPCPGRIARPARHLVRPDTWAALPMCWVRPDVALELACPLPRANVSCVRTQFSWILCQDLGLLDLGFLNIIIFLINIIIFIIVESINIKHIIICVLNIISSIVIQMIVFIPQIIVLLILIL
jgi:hypothetical protein